MTQTTRDFIRACQRHLDESWQGVIHLFETNDDPLAPLVDNPDLIALIRDCLTSKIKTYHYVLPTQILAKAVDPTLDAHSIQTAYATSGAFDARTVAHTVIVPFDRDNHRVLGGSPEPYVNNPVRVPAITARYRSQQKNKADWDKLIAVLDAVEEVDDPDFTQRVLAQVLFEIYQLLADVAVIYPTPNRISLQDVQKMIDAYLGVSSGGERMEAVAPAVFQTSGEEFCLFDQVRREKVNAADASSGMLADIECWSGERIVLLIEVKDRSLTLMQLDSKVDLARSRQIAEILFLTQSGESSVVDDAQINQRVLSEFSSGQNIYIANFGDFSLGILILLGEKGRRNFLSKVGQELDRVNAKIAHRKAWAQLLKEV
jgi:hypothetical protein